MTFLYDDGGRAAAGFKGDTRDCVVRAIAIASGSGYAETYRELAAVCKSEELRSRRAKGPGHPRTGVAKHITRAFLERRGWTWVPTMAIGSGCNVHLRADELPAGKLIVSVSRHVVAVIDGVLHDTHDSSRDDGRCVYGYFYREVKNEKNRNAA